MATELADLVMAGSKRVTASLAPDYGEGYESIPKPGDIVMMLDGEGRPRFIWRTTEVTIKPLSQVDDAFAWDEGEGTARETGGSMRTATAASLPRERFELNDEILTGRLAAWSSTC